MNILKATIPSSEFKGDSYAQSWTISCSIDLGFSLPSLKSGSSGPSNVRNHPLRAQMYMESDPGHKPYWVGRNPLVSTFVLRRVIGKKKKKKTTLLLILCMISWYHLQRVWCVLCGLSGEQWVRSVLQEPRQRDHRIAMSRNQVN